MRKHQEVCTQLSASLMMKMRWKSSKRFQVFQVSVAYVFTIFNMKNILEVINFRYKRRWRLPRSVSRFEGTRR